MNRSTFSLLAVAWGAALVIPTMEDARFQFKVPSP